MKILRITGIALLLIYSQFQNECSAQIKKDTLKVLFVGNSYTYYNNLAQIVSLISDSTNTKLITKKSVIPGAHLSEHWLGQRGLKTREMIKSGHFNIVILQAYSMDPIEVPDSVYKYARLLCNEIKTSGARPYLYLTWAREKVPQYQEDLNRVYEKVATDNGATLIPIGKAWALARELRPGIELFEGDGSHPTNLGTFLNACVITDLICIDIPDNPGNEFWTKDYLGESIRLMALDPLDVIFCIKVAKQVLSDEKVKP